MNASNTKSISSQGSVLEIHSADWQKYDPINNYEQMKYAIVVLYDKNSGTRKHKAKKQAPREKKKVEDRVDIIAFIAINNPFLQERIRFALDGYPNGTDEIHSMGVMLKQMVFYPPFKPLVNRVSNYLLRVWNRRVKQI